MWYPPRQASERGTHARSTLALHLAQEDSMAKKLASKKISRVLPLKKK